MKKISSYVSEDADGFSEAKIKKQYDVHRKLNVISYIPKVTIAFILVNTYFIFTDQFVRKIKALSYPRILPMAFAFILWMLWKKFKISSNLLYIFYMIWIYSVMLMMFALSIETYDTNLFRSTIPALMVAIFAITLATEGGAKTLIPVFFIPLIIFILSVFIFLRFDASIIEYGNLLAVIVACIIIGELNERIRYNDFKLTKQLDLSKQKSEKLLLNILPEETVKELKENGLSKPRKYDSVSVLFADVKAFTYIAEQLSPEELIYQLNYMFTKFDTIMEAFGIEKIKTIGDAYLCAAGLPTPQYNHAHKMVEAALEIQRFMNEMKHETNLQNSDFFKLRIGIHSGPVIAGIVGIKKFAYDIWGDTVNIAARMQSCGEVGRINITGNTYNIIKDKFSCTYRGKIPAKNKGEIDMYFVDDVIK